MKSLSSRYRSSLLVLARISLSLLVPQFAEAAGPANRPNIILLIADDMAWDDCGAYGHKTVRTPNLDKLASEGMRFDRAFLTASSCSPSRSSMITGRYPHSTGAQQLHWPLPADQITFVELLKKSGYWIAAAGKWHLGNDVKDRFDVVKEANPAGFRLGHPSGQPAPQADASGKSGAGLWVPTLQARPKGKPFFLWLAAFDPHRDYDEGIIPNPHRPEDVVVPPYLPDVSETRKDLALYYDEITRLDGYVGDVLAELDRQGERDNTLVLFISDNGRPFPRAKTTLYDSGIKTPWIVRWPKQVKPGSVSNSLVSSVDIAPTFLDLAGVKAGSSFQGRSIAPALKNPRAVIRDAVFAERHWHDFDDHARSARSNRYKYIRNYYPDLPGTPPADAVRSLTFQAMRRLRDAGKLAPQQLGCFLKPRPEEELYDTETDPHELRNLASDPRYAATLNQLRRALAEWQRTTADRLPETRTHDEFDRETGNPLPSRSFERRPPKSSQLKGDNQQ
jgi:N-sulfoglucosamine sulfohydrolase